MRNITKLALFLVLLNLLKIESVKVSPKLDFDSQSESFHTKKDVVSGKIKGLRVTVDTSELKESKSSGSDSSTSSESDDRQKKKTVGVRTDVTFEITSSEVQNDTKIFDEKEIGKDDENASIPIVPVFKGTDRGNNKDLNSNDIWKVKPLEKPVIEPLRPNLNRNNYDPGAVGSWDQFPQYAIWTTERYNKGHDLPVYHHRADYPNAPTNYRPFHRPQHQPWEPCTCKEYPGPYLHPYDDYHGAKKFDDKLEKPFSKTN